MPDSDYFREGGRAEVASVAQALDKLVRDLDFERWLNDLDWTWMV